MKATSTIEHAPLSCGHMPTPDGFVAGYATTPDGRRICYACADKEQRKRLLDRSRPFYAYISDDGHKITTWTGGELMRITRAVPCKLTRFSFTHGKSYSSIRATDCHGGAWFGRGSPGIAIVLHPCKA